MAKNKKQQSTENSTATQPKAAWIDNIRVHLTDQGNLKAFISVRLFEAVYLTGLRVVSSSKGVFVAIASPETAAWDLVYFHVTLGGLNQAALFLKDMALSLDPGRLKVIAGSHDDSRTSRRLGWLLEKCGFPKLAAVLKAKNFLRESRCLAEQGTSGLGSQPYNETWNIIENASLDLKP